MLPLGFGRRQRSRVNRYTLLVAAFSFLAVAVATAAQAAPASADYNYWGLIQTQDPAQGYMRVLNAAGCGNPANVIEWTASMSSCSGGGSNERWDIDVSAAEVPGGNGSAIWAHYNGHYMCLNVRYADYSPGEQIIAYNCDSGVTNNERFQLYPCDAFACGASWGEISPVYGPPNLCLDVGGGFGIGHQIILWSCANSNGVIYPNNLFSLPGW